MAPEATITVFGDEQFALKIAAMGERADDMSPVLESIADDWIDIIEETFASEGRRILGRQWHRLATSTIAKRGSSHPILVETAELLVNMTDQGNIRIENDEIMMELPDSVETKAASHQYGFHNASANKDVPARPMIGFTPLDRKVWNTRMTDYLVNGKL